MPMYEYECTNENCNHVQKRDFSMSKMKQSTKCEKCGKKSNKIFSRVTGIVAEGDEFFTSDGKFE